MIGAVKSVFTWHKLGCRAKSVLKTDWGVKNQDHSTCGLDILHQGPFSLGLLHRGVAKQFFGFYPIKEHRLDQFDICLIMGGHIISS